MYIVYLIQLSLKSLSSFTSTYKNTPDTDTDFELSWKNTN